MNKAPIVFACIVIGLMALCQAPTYGFTIQVIPSITPKGPSASFDGYSVNAQNALENGLNAIGDPATQPTAYQSANAIGTDQFEVATRDLIISSFPSWRGQAAPTGAFANEQGNRLHFGLHILGDGTRFSLAQLEFESSSDIFNPDLTVFTAASLYDEFRRGINYGDDGVKGGGDDIVYMDDESADLPIDELILTGVAVNLPIAPSGATDQEQLDSLITQLNDLSPFHLTGTYTLFDDDINHTNVLVSGSADVQVNPEPTTALVIFVVALVWLAVQRPGAIRTSG